MVFKEKWASKILKLIKLSNKKKKRIKMKNVTSFKIFIKKPRCLTSSADQFSLFLCI